MKLLRLRRDRLPVYLVIAVAVLAAGYFDWRQLAIRQQKRAFAQAEVRLQELSGRIQSRIGEAHQTKTEHTCGRANLKSSKGPLSCSVSIHLLYENRGYIQANEYMKEIVTMTGATSLRRSAGTQGNEFVPPGSQKSSQQFFQEIESYAGLNCDVVYEFPVSSFDHRFQLVFPENLRFGVVCSSASMAEYFPTK